MFSDCTNLANVFIPNSVTTIGERAFTGCKSLTGITLPEALTTLENEAFNSCSSLASITIPSSVTLIGYYAFCGCISLAEVTCQAITPPTVNHDLSFATYEATLFVPYQSLEDYRTHEIWGQFLRAVPFVGAGPGDVNGDGNITVGDVTNLIDMLLMGEEERPAYADVDGDGNVTIKDIATLIDMLLNNH